MADMALELLWGIRTLLANGGYELIVTFLFGYYFGRHRANSDEDVHRAYSNDITRLQEQNDHLMELLLNAKPKTPHQ
jgi:hypothetical protein